MLNLNLNEVIYFLLHEAIHSLLIILLVLFDWRRVRSLQNCVLRLVPVPALDQAVQTVQTHVQLVQGLLTDILVDKGSHLVGLLAEVTVSEPQPGAVVIASELPEHHLVVQSVLHVGALVARVVHHHVCDSTLVA